MFNVKDYRKLIASIRELLRSGIDERDREVLLQFLKSVRNMCEFNILKCCYDQDALISSYVPDIETKMMDLGREIDALESKMLSEGSLSSLEAKRLNAAHISYNRYRDIKIAIKERKYDHYVEFMNKNIDNASQLIALCGSVLANADLDYMEEFVIDSRRKSVVDIIFELKNNSLLRESLNKYFRRERFYKIESEIKVTEDNSFLEYLETIKENESLVRRFMEMLYRVGPDNGDKIIVVKERLSRNRLRLSQLSRSFLDSIKSTRERIFLNDQISADEKQLKELEDLNFKLEGSIISMENAGLGAIVTQFQKNNTNTDTSVEQKVVDYLKAAMKKESFDISLIERKIKEETEDFRINRAKRNRYVNTMYEDMSTYAKDLVSKYPEATKKMLDVVNGRATGSIDPLIASYVLKGILDAKSIPYEELNNIIMASYTAGIDALVEGYKNIVNNTRKNISDHLDQVAYRVPYDQTSYEDLKIL